MSSEPLSQSFALREEIDAALSDERSYDAWSKELREAHKDHKGKKGSPVLWANVGLRVRPALRGRTE